MFIQKGRYFGFDTFGMDPNNLNGNFKNKADDEILRYDEESKEQLTSAGLNPETSALRREIKSIERQVAEMSRRMKMMKEQFTKIKLEDNLTEKRLAQVKAQDV